MAVATYQAIEAALSLAAVYTFSPLEAVDIFLPNMWPFSNAKRFDPVKDIPNLANKVILVTGGNTGIGKETVLQLAKHKPKHIYLAARTQSKAQDAIASIKGEIADAGISWLPLDLTSLPSIKKAAETVHAETDRLDILVLNAGIMATPPGRTEAGHDIQQGTNHLGHFLLTTLLLPKMQATAEEAKSDVRIISVASEANQMAPGIDTIISTEKLVKTGPWTRYGASKASNIMFAAELARRYPSITSISVHPGLIKTDLYNPSAAASIFLKTMFNVGSFAFVSVPEGALTQLYAAAGAPKEDLKNGQYYTPYGKLRANKWASNGEYARRLWEWSESELKAAGH